MMNKRTSLFAVAAMMAAFAGNQAMAADLAPPPPPAPEIRPAMNDWTGPYVGAVLGGTCMDTKANYYTYGYTDANGNGAYDPGERNSSPSHILPNDMNGCGFTGGIMAGFNYQIDNIVFGLEADWIWGGKTGTHYANHFSGGTLYTEKDAYNIDWMISVRPRVGFLANGDTLFYVTGGPSWLRGEVEDVNSGTSFKNTHFGYAIGGGIEHALTENIHLRAEYLFSSYKKKTYGRFCTSCDVAVDVEEKMDQFHTLRVGASWNFPISSW